MANQPPDDAARSHARGRHIADAFRLATLVSIGIAAIWFGIPSTLGFAVVFAGLLIPRFLHLTGPFDAAFSATILLATWSGVAGLYAAISWWDLVVHFVTAGSSAGVLYLLLAQLDVTPGTSMGKTLPSKSIVVLTVSFGVTLAVVWEFLEWFVNAFISDGIHVGYIDTLTDIAVGGAGALLTGLLLAMWKDQAAEIQASAN